MNEKISQSSLPTWIQAVSSVIVAIPVLLSLWAFISDAPAPDGPPLEPVEAVPTEESSVADGAAEHLAPEVPSPAPPAPSPEQPAPVRVPSPIAQMFPNCEQDARIDPLQPLPPAQNAAEDLWSAYCAGIYIRTEEQLGAST